MHSNTRVSAVQFDKKLEVKQTLTGELLSRLPQALENGEFRLYLQPKFSPKDLSVIGAEALTRWIKPDGTVVYPDQFIPILESTGRIVDLDLYIFEQVAQFLQRKHRPAPVAAHCGECLGGAGPGGCPHPGVQQKFWKSTASAPGCWRSN